MRSTTRNPSDVSTVRRFVSILVLAGLATGGAACGDDEGAASPQAFCDLARELDQQTQFPSDDQLEELTDAAPDQIAGDVELVTEALVARGEAAFAEPDVETAIAAIERYEVEECGLEGDDAAEEDPDELAGLTPDADHPYCDIEDQIDATFQDAGAGAPDQGAAIEDAAQRVVDEGLLEDGRALVPDDIRAEFQALASAVEDAASGDLQGITSGSTERAGRRVDYFCGQN